MSSEKFDINTFDPNGVGVQGRLFGMPFSVENAKLVVIPVAWDVTVSFREGTSKGPAAILEASPQLDFYQEDITDAWKLGIALAEFPEKLSALGADLRQKVNPYIEALEEGTTTVDAKENQAVLSEINKGSEKLNDWLYQQSSEFLAAGKLVATIGGDHSTPLGLIRALAEVHNDFGILHIDAHADLREAYEGFEFSHASIMQNVLQLEEVKSLVQVGIRDFCEDEVKLVKESDGRVVMFTDAQLKKGHFQGISWHQQVMDIVERLPQHVYISFDIDGLDPSLCPNTGTPVAGGLSFNEALYLLEQTVRSGRTIIGFDLSEVGDDPWDANVGARILYRLSNLMGVSQNQLSFNI